MNCFRGDDDPIFPKWNNNLNRSDILMSQAVKMLPRLLALLVLVVQLPALIVVALLVLLSSPGPALVKKAYRRNKTGELVYLYEFRTECWRTLQPTRLGALLHLSDMHRLPRLLNVLQGEVNVGERIQALQ